MDVGSSVWGNNFAKKSIFSVLASFILGSELDTYSSELVRTRVPRREEM